MQDDVVATFSIVAVDLETGDVGVAVQSKFPNVRPVVPWMETAMYDHPHPLRELERLYHLHQLYFFRSDPANRP